MPSLDSVSHSIIGAAIAVHREVGPGLLESVYQSCMSEELRARGLYFDAQVPVPVHYKGVQLDCGYRVDFIVEDRIVVELKSIKEIDRIHHAQVQTYLKLLNLPLGLLINFNVLYPLTRGIRRIIMDSMRSNSAS